MTLIAFSRMMQAIERSTPSRSETIIRDSWPTFDDPELLIKIMALEYEPTNIGSIRAKKWVTKALGLFDDELDNLESLYGDFTEGIYLDSQNSVDSSISLREFDNLLSMDCSSISAPSYRLFRDALLLMSGVERKWFLRFWLRNPRNGLRKGNLEKAVGKLYEKPLKQIRKDLSYHNLSEIVSYYIMEEDPPVFLSFGQFIKPMLAKPLVSKKKKFKGGIVDYKYDGNRYQIHRNKELVIIFNRRGKVVTDQYPDIVEDVLTWKQSSFILDTEIYPINPDGSPAPHKVLGTRVHSKNKTEAVEKCPVKMVIFDAMKVGDTVLIDMSLTERLEHISELPNQATRWIEPESRKACYTQAIAEGFEGIMIKNPDAPYAPGKRSNDWLKHKPPLIELDVVILGVRYGEGKRSDVFGSYLMGVKDGNSFQKIGWVGTGLSDVQLTVLTNTLRKHIESYDKGIMFTLPRVVLTVKSDLISTNADGSIGLRFPRVSAIRDDKPVVDIDTIERIKELM